MRALVLGLAIVCFQISAGIASELTGTLKRINDRGQVNLGFREFEPPMSFRDSSGKAIGYSIDLCERIVAAVKGKLGRSDIKVNYVPVTAKNRFTAIETGKIDILCGATTKTLQRSERVGFTQLTFVTGASLMSLRDSKVLRVAGLKGKRVAVVANTTTIKSLKTVLRGGLIDAKVVPVSSAAAGLAALDKREVDDFFRTRSSSSAKLSPGRRRNIIIYPRNCFRLSLLPWRSNVATRIFDWSRTPRCRN